MFNIPSLRITGMFLILPTTIKISGKCFLSNYGECSQADVCSKTL